MEKDERDLLDVLKFELSFLEKGGYGRSPREAWRPVYIFEDSPTCMNYDCKNDPAPCSDCVLMQLVPPELRAGKTPCRRIQLNASGETLDSLYRYGDDHEIEETLKSWLRATIAQLEVQRGGPQPDGHAQPANPGLPKVTETPLCQTFARSAQIPRARLRFVGRQAANSFASVQSRFLLPSAALRRARRSDSMVPITIGSANAAPMSLLWCTTKSLE
jgi:hypothetical protein